ncbi:MAG: DUF2802 domain-containing protein [Gammaproteobacteria bacterium]|nr:DUF2802 domain-containing protein [Gammaproteobacteria bacterium]
MDGIGDPWALAGAAIGVIAAALGVVGLWIVRAQAARLAERETAIEDLRRRVDALTALQTRTANRLQRFETEQGQLAERVGHVESGGGRTLDDAIDSARRGASVGTLIDTFGLSRGEASLIARLHGRTGD